MGKEKIKRPLLLPEGFQGASTSDFYMSSGGAATFGGTLTASSNATVSGTLTPSSDMTVGGKATFNGGAYEEVQTVSTTGATLNANGLSLLTSTAVAAHTLPAPEAGLHKFLIKTANSTAAMTVTTASTSQTVDGSNTVITFNGQNQRAELIGASSTRWVLVTSTASVGNLS